MFKSIVAMAACALAFASPADGNGTMTAAADASRNPDSLFGK